MRPFLKLDCPALCEHFRSERGQIVEAGDFICDKLSTREHVVFIRSGTARISLVSPKGSERLLFFASSGCMFGDSMVFGRAEDVCLSLRGVAMDTCELIKVEHDVFRRTLVEHPELMWSVVDIAYRKFVIAIEQLEYAAFKDTESQVNDLLEAISNDGRGPDSPFAHMTHQDLADVTGRTRVSVTNALSRLRDAGKVRLSRGRVELLDRKADRC